MKPIGLKIPMLFRGIFFITLAVSWFTGLGFFLLERFFQVQGEFGIEKNPFQNPALTVHGAAAFLMMIWFGGILSAHVPMGWRTKKLRYWGLLLSGSLGFQILTAYGLYYISNAATRTVLEWLHLGVGICLPFILLGHILVGRKQRRTTRNS